MSAIINSINLSFGFKAFASSIQLNIEKHDREALFLAEVQRLTSQLDSFNMAVAKVPSSALIVRPSMHMIPFASSGKVQPESSTSLSVRPTMTVARRHNHMTVQLVNSDWSVYQVQFPESEDDEDDYYDYDYEQLMFSSMVFDHEQASHKHTQSSKDHFIIDLLDLIQLFYQSFVPIFYTALFSIALSRDRNVRFKEEFESLNSLVDSMEPTKFLSTVCPPGQPSPFNIVSIYDPWKQFDEETQNATKDTVPHSPGHIWLPTAQLIVLVILYIVL